MRIKLFFATAATATALLSVAACSSSTDTAATSSAPMPAMSTAMSSEAMTTAAMAQTGTFTGLNGKTVAGTAKIDGSTVTLTGFSSDEGPDLHLYLAKGNTEDAISSGVQLGTVAFDQASQTFTIPASATGDYTYVVVRCDKARAIFGAAMVTK